MSADPWDEPSAKAWVHHVITDMVPKLESSACTISLVPDDVGDVKFWVELGASIMLDKPILLVVTGMRPIPPKLALLADDIVRLPHGINASGSEELAAAIKRMVER